MNLRDAILTGRRIRQKDRGQDWLSPGILFNSDEIIADNWEVEEAPVTITASQFWEAFGLCWAIVYPAIQMNDRLANELAQKLGLEPQ
jgi:hypothetical protein